MNLVDKSCKTTEWYTPLRVVNLVREFFIRHSGRGIDLDPATSLSNPTGARVFFSQGGLHLDWSTGAGKWPVNVFVNPPYGRELPDWIRKIGREMSRSFRGCNLVALLPSNRFETRYWQESLGPYLRFICFVRGRLKFDRPEDRAAGVETKESGNPFGSVLVTNFVGADSEPLRRLGLCYRLGSPR